MDSETSVISNENNKKYKHKNEKTKEIEEKETDNTLDAVCIQMNKLAEQEDNGNESGASSDSEDLINAINYNTITSLAALKDIIQGENTDTPETDSFFQHYFMNHCNNLSSRSSSTASPFPYAERRRLSQCREEDEEDYKKELDPPPSAVSSETASEVTSQGSIEKELNTDDTENISYVENRAVPNQDTELLDTKSPKRTVMGAKHKFIVTTAEPSIPVPAPKPISKEPIERALRFQVHNAHTVHFGTKGAEEQRPNVRSIFVGENLHRDKNYFDSSLIEIRSPVNGLLTNSEDIWVKRTNEKPVIHKKEQFSNHEHPDSIEKKISQQESDKPQDRERSRSGTWSSQSVSKEQTKAQPSREREGTKNVDSRRNKREQKLDVAITRSTQSVGERKRRASDDAQAHTLYQQTIHGTSGVSRRPALFNMFKGKNKGEPKKQSSLMKHVISAMQHLTKTTSKSEEEVALKYDIHPSPVPEAIPSLPAVVKDGSAHPHPGSDTSYYHTIAESTSRRPSGAIARMRDIFRTTFTGQSLPPETAVRRKSKTLAQKQQHTSGANVRRAATQRRSSIGHVPQFRHRASDSFLDPQHAAMLFRDSRGLPVADPFLEKVSRSDLEEDESQIFVKFFKFHKCYDLIPTSAKLVVFDTQLLVKKAFFALVYNGVRAAPLWDSQQQKFVGMLTITDFIKILQMYYTSPNVAMDELEEHRLETWRHVLKGSVQPLVYIGPDSSLYEAIRILILNRIHRLPVINPETGDVLYILTHKRILRFLFLYINELPKPSYLKFKIRDLRIGTLSDIEMATEGTTIIEALKKFVNRRVSALPIVDEQGRLKDIYAKFDVINLAAEKTYNDLDVSLKTANEYRNEWFEGVQKCKLDETLYEVMEKIVRAEVHRLVVVDEDEKVIGIISLSDLLMYLVLRPTGECEGASLRNEHTIQETDESAEPTELAETTEQAELIEHAGSAVPTELAGSVELANTVLA